MDIELATQNVGSNEVYIKESVPQAVEKNRKKVIKRAMKTLKHLKAYDGGKLSSPMAKAGLNCIKLKIGYSDRNKGFFEVLEQISELRMYGATVEERRGEAIKTIENFIEDVKFGDVDLDLENYLSTPRHHLNKIYINYTQGN